ncbi:type I-E CRISPR-associated protein Cse1/CasA [Streptomyces sp. JJ36]|uniref:type I-E CRISPR-associated protein Cse1/CasA n=1 Tax=Streptomyces sp. JJ36 TaxID=2736645 RepID=UPI001F011376|nr:type I-E CRISPR-associated protein Cse1/CasA [Streptomyces sp. JJ36]MCF6523775.1 type I-E CRISPR-associated protein Cse1/CasA [Streptomyces sp. JJ36]
MPRGARYPLTTKPWLGVRWKPGHQGPPAVGLRDVLVHAQDIAALTVSPPPALSALYRILYALTARVTGLDEARKGREDWLDRRADVLHTGIDAQRVDDYLEPLSESFDLFGPRPFLQDPRLAEQCPKPAGVNKLLFGRSAGNNHSWFGHHRDAAPHLPQAPEAALHLLMWLYYGPSGRCGTRNVEKASAADVSAGPLRSSLSYHPEGSTLLESLLAGLVPPETTDRAETDLCPWERPGPLDPLSAPETGKGPCSRLTSGWQHAVLLVPDEDGRTVKDAYVTWAHRQKLPRTDDAYLIWQTSQQGNPYPRYADSGRALWRDLDALLLKNATGAGRPRRPTVLASTAELEEVLDNLAVRALGFEQDGKTKDVQYVSATTPPVLANIDDNEPELAHSIGALRVAGERYGGRLAWAVKKAWADITESNKVGECAWSDQAAALYWPAAEALFWTRLQARDFEGGWRDFRRSALDTFERVTDSAPPTPRAVRAVEEARLEIFGGRRRR